FRSRERQAAQLRESVRELIEAALQHDDVARTKPQRAEPMRDPLAAPADREQPDLEPLREPQLRGGASDERGITAHDGLDHAEVLPLRVAGPQILLLGRELEAALPDDALDRARIAFEQQQVVRVQ